MDENEKPKAMGDVTQIDEARIHDHLEEIMRGTVEEALNAMLDAEADQLCGADRYERSEGRKDTRRGSNALSCETVIGYFRVDASRNRLLSNRARDRLICRMGSIWDRPVRHLHNPELRKMEQFNETFELNRRRRAGLLFGRLRRNHDNPLQRRSPQNRQRN